MEILAIWRLIAKTRHTNPVAPRRAGQGERARSQGDTSIKRFRSFAFHKKKAKNAQLAGNSVGNQRAPIFPQHSLVFVEFTTKQREGPKNAADTR